MSTYLSVTRDVAQCAGCELSGITRSPHRARERLLFGRRRLYTITVPPRTYVSCTTPVQSHIAPSGRPSVLSSGARLSGVCYVYA